MLQYFMRGEEPNDTDLSIVCMLDAARRRNGSSAKRDGAWTLTGYRLNLLKH
jgi:hypothetical protein